VPVLGLHHVTASVLDPQHDVDFWVDTLGLRLVKRTVDFDDPSGYHLFYGDECGTPGTLVSTMPAGRRSMPQGQPGAGQTVATTLSVPPGALDFWRDRLRAEDVPFAEGRARFDDECVVLRERSGLVLELMSAADERVPWESTIERAAAVRGLHSVAIVVQYAGPTVDFLIGALDCRRVAEEPGRIRLALGDGGVGRLIDVLHDDDATAALDGVGTVQHVALIGEDLDLIRAKVAEYGVSASEVRDERYFSSIQFRAPGGVLFKVATAGPGFLVDEDLRTLGLNLQLPPWLEADRDRILARLPSVSV
jgi:glyoxalase family protein